MSKSIFFATLAVEALTTLAVVFSILFPKQRIWPPNERKVWGKPAMLIFFNLTAVGIISLGILDWNSYIISIWAQIAIGLPLWLIGNILAVWAVIALGLARTSGEADKLIRHGPYRFSRNPQYLGFMLGLVGWAVLTNSGLTIVAVLATLPSLILVPFAEELLLQTCYGSEYKTYKRDVPRFFALKR
jgi:protein-S-isoprenylcysteine O-methyltransferase Ste14